MDFRFVSQRHKGNGVMVRNTARVVLAIFLLQSAPNAVHGSQRANAPAKAPWALEVLTLGSTPPTALWVGLINRSDEARLVCILDSGITFEERGAPGALVTGSSPHACKIDEQFQLVRGGETHFTRLPLTEGLAARVAGRIRVELGFLDRPALGNTSGREPVVRWEGTLQEAADRGRALTGARKKD